MPLARNCALSLDPVVMVGRTVTPGYIFLLTCSSIRYISVLTLDGGEGGCAMGSGAIFTAGSPMIFVISAKNCGTFSSGRARTSMVASASDGITLGPIPAFSMVGTMDVRSMEYLLGSCSAR